MNPVKAGLVGCGKISGAYLEGLRPCPGVEVAACSDLDLERARLVAAEYGVPRGCGVDELLADPSIELVINLTVPAAHAEVNRRILEAGKHVFLEKPFSVSREEGRPIMELAASRNLLVGCAPDTVLGPGLQTSRKAIDDGLIGDPVGAVAFLASHGVESWHPNPDFYYHPGGGPLFDMGPYYLTALIQLLGPMTRVSASAKVSFPSRQITSQPLAGQIIQVKTPTHISGSVDFANGAMATVLMSFDVWTHRLPCIEVYGSKGTLSVPDPNMVAGQVQLKLAGEENWKTLKPVYGPVPHRGAGVADLAQAIRENRKSRTDGKIALHVVDAMQAFLESSDRGERVVLSTSCERPLACFNQPL